MKIRKFVTFTAMAVMAAQLGYSQDVEVVHVWDSPGQWWGSHFAYAPGGPRFTAQELSFDAFASYVAAERKFADVFETNIRHGTWGGGVGLNYFLTRELGVGLDANVGDNGGNFIDYVAGSLIARLPFESTGLAPYVFGGGGRATEPVWEWTGHVGVGLEARLNPVTGIFVDGRYVWAEDATDTAVLRAGLRLVF